MKGRVLIVDDEPEMCRLLEADLGARGYTCTWTTETREALLLLGRDAFDVVLTDLYMPELSGLDLCDRIVARSPGVPVVVMTAFGSMDAAVEALRASAFDFVTKPLEIDLLDLVLHRAVRHGRLVERVRLLSHPVAAPPDMEGLIGRSQAMLAVREQIHRIAETDVSVLLTGETGTGKELVARAICGRSPRRDQPFVTVDCAALPPSLIESELFGHERGAFTDANVARKGLFCEAHRGTLFLDEIGEIPLETQPKLLRALEERRVRPVGSTEETPVDVRIITATNRDLPAAIEAGAFREDLYYRIHVVEIHLPPLRERGRDALDIAQHFVSRYAEHYGKAVGGLSEGAAKRIVDYAWPGNVRELRNAIERAVALTAHEKLTVEDLPETIRETAGPPRLHAAWKASGVLPLAEMERRYILEVLRLAHGRKARAAAMLGLDRKTLYRKLQRWEEEA